MNVPSFPFLGFVALVALAINALQATRWRRAVLLVANLAFVATFERRPQQLVPFAGLLLLGFVALKVVERCKLRPVFIGLLGLEIATFCWLKQYAFVPHAAFLQGVYFTVGMSYVFFRILHLLIDGYQQMLPDAVSPLNYINYTLNFTALVAGPIQFYRDYLTTESEHPLPLDLQSAGIGTTRIVTGFFKAAIAAPLVLNLNDRVVNDTIAGPSTIGPIADAAGLLGIYAIYLYLNFSGYTDVVIGAARFLRLKLPENFDRPFEARSFIDLWSRWHITLSTWLKTYVYSPFLLAAMRRFPSPAIEPALGVIAYFVTFFLVGAWHGQTTAFLFFGVLQGLGVSVNKAFQIVMLRRLGRERYRALCARPFFEAASRGATYTYFGFTLFWFWSTWSQLGAFVRRLDTGAVIGGLALLFVASSATLFATHRLLEAYRARDRTDRPYVRTAYVTILATIVVSVVLVLAAPAPRIVYRGF